ncbi:MAG: riboflavin biosynthesis protein RibD [Bdellovibrionales bacterium CG10_big_fil_rev_8_21_14_0_10_45_34]|nr:MAG: riboflavin biosynthesis protein RibD [Bdellovibrionales bacterium CG10_big_fil_rev_8_21_14_0_10_45_34]
MIERKRPKKLTDSEAMAMAIEEAKKGLGHVAPNPPVGCVILDREGRLLSKGFHQRFGGSHAEIEALKGISADSVEGASVFVTLEPCSHFGKTPPCADKLITLALRRVVFGVVDPNPEVSGRGAERIANANIPISEYEDENGANLKGDLEDLIEVFSMNQRLKAPFVSLKVASSLDGQMALKSGESQWITNEASRHHAHFLRATHDAVIIGSRTVEIDDPKLNIRRSDFADRTNKVVVMDPAGSLFKKRKDLALYKVRDPKEIFFVVSDKMPATNSDEVNIIRLAEEEPGQFDLKELLKVLFSTGVKSLLLEGGSHLYGSFLKQRLVHRIFYYQAPILLGSTNGLSWSSGIRVGRMSERISLKRVKIDLFGDDILVSGRID